MDCFVFHVLVGDQRPHRLNDLNDDDDDILRLMYYHTGDDDNNNNKPVR